MPLTQTGRHVPWPDWADDYFAEEYADGHTRATFLKLACLLHDVAKPETKSVQPNGRVRFLGHPVKGATTTHNVLRRLRTSGKAREAVAVMVEQHLRPSQLAQRGELPTARAIYRYYRDLKDVAVDTLYLCMADYLAARGPGARPGGLGAALRAHAVHAGRGTSPKGPSAPGAATDRPRPDDAVQSTLRPGTAPPPRDGAGVRRRGRGQKLEQRR